MWFIFSLITIVCWGGSDLFSKLGSRAEDKLSHWKLVIAVGGVMGVHAAIELLSGVRFDMSVMIAYLPVSALYISSMILGYVGLRHIMLSVSSPICNSSGAITAILCFLILKQTITVFQLVAVVMITVGVILLAVFERKSSLEHPAAKGYKNSFIAIFFPIFYCVLDGVGSFADALVLETLDEAAANTAYELTFLLMGIFAAIYVFGIKREKLKPRAEWPKLAGALCETAGQFTYIFAMGENAIVAAPMIASYSMVSVIFSRIFLKERARLSQYIAVAITLAGIIILGCFE